MLICLDPQDLNKALKIAKHPLPTLKEIIPKLIRKNLYTVINLSDELWKVGRNDESSKLCNFRTLFGTHKFLRLPFGLNVLPEIFLSSLNKLFFNVKNIIIYFDDIMICADTNKEQDAILKQVVNITRRIILNLTEIKYIMV